MRFYFDFETASCCDLSLRGLHNYACDPTTRVLMMSYAWDDAEVQLWQPHEAEMPAEAREALLDPAVTKVAWNSQFERYILQYVLGITLPASSFCDPMIWARHLSLPGSLEECGEALGLKEDEAKIKDGKKLIRLFCEPFSEGGEVTLFGTTQPEFHDHVSNPEEWQKFCDYCKRDTETERTLLKIMERLPLPEIEQRGWVLDQKINDAGIPVDVGFIKNALSLAVKSKDELDKLLLEKTKLDNPNSRNQILEWAQTQGYPHKSMKKEFVANALANENSGLSDLGREVLTIRQEAAKTSYKKYETILELVSPDGRVRNQFLYMGASRTGRWSGTGFQPQNPPRPMKEVEEKYERAVELIRANDYEGIKAEFKCGVIGVVTSCVRSAIQVSE